MIVGHHMGEGALLGALAAGGTTAAASLLLVTRARVDQLLRWLRRK